MNDFKFKKKFGQNFLTDQNIINKIILAISPRKDDNFIEIGPGQGALTKFIIGKCKAIDIIEIDADLVDYLQTLFIGRDNLTIFHHDALTFNFNELCNFPARIIGNLPYNISTPLLFHMLTIIDQTIDCVFMLQKEVAMRIAAIPNNKQYGRLSVMLQYYYKTEVLFDISPHAFYPKPKVTSSIIKLTPLVNKSILAKDESLFADIVKQAFSMRRKTITNALKNYLLADTLMMCEIDSKSRPENLSVADFVNISNSIYKDN